MNGQGKYVGMHPRPQNQSLAKAPHQIKAGQKKKKKKNKSNGAEQLTLHQTEETQHSDVSGQKSKKIIRVIYIYIYIQITIYGYIDIYRYRYKALALCFL